MPDLPMKAETPGELTALLWLYKKRGLSGCDFIQSCPRCGLWMTMHIYFQ